MLFKDSTEDFIFNKSWSRGNDHFNFLKDTQTRITTSTTLIFADGETEGANIYDEDGEIVSGPKLGIVVEINVENPSEFLQNNQELANSVKYILVKVPTNEQ
jgi:hypothetical protein